MEDPQRQPKDSDRSLVAGRIKRASDEGRISGADRDIRLGNVWNAQSMAELDLMTRELDQLDATPLPTTTPPVGEKPWSKFTPAASDDDDDEVSDTVASATTSSGPAPSSASRAALVSILVGIAVLTAVVGSPPAARPRRTP
ncbi:MAG: hypothetical protein JWR90_271 [Marmoricola sp.]|nr:hypothetical protein [Marmoricola sp.]